MPPAPAPAPPSSAPASDAAAPAAAAAAAAPAPAVVTLPLARNPARPAHRSGAAAYARAARRYGFDSPTFVGRAGVVYRYRTLVPDAHTRAHPAPRAAVDPDTPAAEVPAQDIQNDLEYVVPVRIGTPGVTVRLDFDTGSSDLWVWSSELRGRLANHNIYNPAKSSTSKAVKGAKWSISYGDGSSARGNVYTDTIHIGDLAIPNQAVELAQQLSSSFLTEEGSDGLLGLAFPGINTVQPTQVLTPVANMVAQKLASGVFSVALDRRDDNGFYTFGGIDPARAGVSPDAIKYVPVDNTEGFWLFDSASATVNGKKIARKNNTAIADTGTTLALIDDRTVRAIYAAVPGAKLDAEQGGWVFPAGAAVPEVKLAVGDTLYAISPADFVFADAGDGMVFGGIQSRGTNPFDILGDTWLKSLYVVFDQDKVRLGVAQRTGNVPPAAPEPAPEGGEPEA